jgi:hypothetical protein
MTSEQFTYWLQGFIELYGEIPSEAQWQSIKEHLQTVFVKVTPPVGGGGSGIGTLSEQEFTLPGWLQQKTPIAITC